MIIAMPAAIRDQDRQVRSAAFAWLRDQVSVHGPVLPRDLLAAGFELRGVRVPLVGPQGIFKPQLADMPLSITTSPASRYNDHFGPAGLRYAYRGTNPQHHENVGLRRAMQGRVPLVYFHGLVPNRYLAQWPVFVVADDPARLTFTVAVDDAESLSTAPSWQSNTADPTVLDGGEDARRRYVTALFRRRLHQEVFRERVLRAYREQCALCRLRHVELLDAAHISGDTEPDGEPVVPNGLALCKLHHAAFDGHFLSIRPDYVVEVKRQILDEEDGPMLLHGLKEMHGHRIVVPTERRLRPDPKRLARRFELFQAVG
jgi:putative restriction endonuclease